MRIIQVGPFPEHPTILIKGGVQASVYGLARALSDTGADIIVLAEPQNDVANDYKTHCGAVNVHFFKRASFLQISGLLRVPAYWRAISAAKPDIVHLHGSFFVVYALLPLLRLLRAAPLIIYTVHGIAAVETAKKYAAKPSLKTLGQRLLYTSLEYIGMLSAHRLIVDTPYVVAALPQHLKKSCHVIPQGIFLDEHNGDAAKPNDGLIRFVSLGVLHPRKSHHLLLEAFARVHAAKPETRLRIIGAATDPAYAALLRSTISRLKLDAVVDLGLNLPRPDVLTALREADVFALHSEEESQGIALCEAMAMSLPIVATRVGGIPDVVTEGETALLTEYGDIQGFAAAMERLAGDTALRAQFSAAAHKRGLDFGWDALSKRVINEVYSPR